MLLSVVATVKFLGLISSIVKKKRQEFLRTNSQDSRDTCGERYRRVDSESLEPVVFESSSKWIPITTSTA